MSNKNYFNINKVITYFPYFLVGLSQLQDTAYLQPVRSSCNTMIFLSLLEACPVRKNTNEDKDISDKLKHKRELSNGLGSPAKVATASNSE